MSDERFNRSFDILQASDLDIHIVGAGGIGSWTALCLAKLGYEHITIYDFDKVEEHNVGPQLYGPSHVGLDKVVAVGNIVNDLTGIMPTGINAKPTSIKGDVLIMAVDSMASRKELAALIPNFQFVIDGRMGGLVSNVYAFLPFEQARYETTLCSDEEAVQEPCTSKAICFNVFSIASTIGNLVKRYDKGEKFPFEINTDMVNIKTYTSRF